MTPRERAERAQQLLDDPLFNEAFANVRAGLVDRLEASPISDVETQHEIALMLQLLKRLRTQIEAQLRDFRVMEAEQKQQDWLSKARQKIRI